jgi:hypothetical protein
MAGPHPRLRAVPAGPYPDHDPSPPAGFRGEVRAADHPRRPAAGPARCVRAPRQLTARRMPAGMTRARGRVPWVMPLVAFMLAALATAALRKPDDHPVSAPGLRAARVAAPTIPRPRLAEVPDLPAPLAAARPRRRPPPRPRPTPVPMRAAADTPPSPRPTPEPGPAAPPPTLTPSPVPEPPPESTPRAAPAPTFDDSGVGPEFDDSGTSP